MKPVGIGDIVRVQMFDCIIIGKIIRQYPVLEILTGDNKTYPIIRGEDTFDVLSDEQAMIYKLENL